jgi:hypothetical protein
MQTFQDINMKICIKCNEVKVITEFHKHSGMSDGHLNKCRSCVVLAVAAWREKNPEARKHEYSKSQRGKQAQLGFEMGFRNRPGEGRNCVKTRIRGLKYAHKRRAQTETPMTEWDMFVAEEAFKLSVLRNTQTSHKWTVDHIVPLNHKEASGLHNGFNLQVVPASWNFKKGNRNMDSFWPIKPLGA